MGLCQFCGEKAGFLKKYHEECFSIHQQKIEDERLANEQKQKERERLLHEERERNARVSTLVYESLCHNNAECIESGLIELKNIGIPQNIFANEVKNGLNRYFGEKLKRTVVTDLSLGIMNTALSTAGISIGELNPLSNFDDLIKSLILKDVLEKSPQCRICTSSSIPINLQKDEIVLWIFTNVKYYETKTKTEYVGRNSGVNVRIMKGVSYRVGASQGQAIKTDVKTQKGKGILVVTQKNLYFHGTEASFRVPYKKIVSYTPYTDGIGIQRDAQTAKPQDFLTDDGWFTNALITGVSALLQE